MESSSRRWLRISCEGDKKTVEFLSELFSYFVGTLPVEDDLFEEASHNGNLKEISESSKYVIEIKDSNLINALLFFFAFRIP